MKYELISVRKTHRDRFEFEQFSDPYDILLLVQKGSFCCKRQFGIKNETVQETEAFSFQPNEHYERYVTEPVDIYIFRYRSDCQIFPEGKIAFLDMERIRSTMALYDAVLCNPLMDAFSCAQTIFADIILQYRIENGNSLQSVSSDEVVEAAKKYMADSIKKKVCFEKMAEDFGLSYMQFFRRFKAATELSPSEYLFTIRMKKAASLLETTSLPVRSIAEQCGFFDEYYFSNRFKQYAHISPVHYRKNVQDQAEKPMKAEAET